MFVQRTAQLHIHAVGGVRKHIGAYATQQHLKHGDRQKTDSQHIQRFHAVVHQHFVHHHLKKQRREQRKNLQEKTDGDNFYPQFFVFAQHRNKPADIKLLMHAFH